MDLQRFFFQKRRGRKRPVRRVKKLEFGSILSYSSHPMTYNHTVIPKLSLSHPFSMVQTQSHLKVVTKSFQSLVLEKKMFWWKVYKRGLKTTHFTLQQGAT